MNSLKREIGNTVLFGGGQVHRDGDMDRLHTVGRKQGRRPLKIRGGELES